MRTRPRFFVVDRSIQKLICVAVIHVEESMHDTLHVHTAVDVCSQQSSFVLNDCLLVS